MIESLQSIIEKIDARISDRSSEANKAGQNGDSYWVTVCLSETLGLLAARRFLLEEIARQQ